MILPDNFLSFIRRCWLLNNQTRNLSITNKETSSEYQTEKGDNFTKGLKILRLKYAQNSIISQINLNSLWNKFELLVSKIASNTDVLMIPETKNDGSFPTSQFLIDGFSSPYYLDRYANANNIIITKSLKTINLSIEAIFIEMNLRSKKGSIYFTYNPNKYLLEHHLNQIQA